MMKKVLLFFIATILTVVAACPEAYSRARKVTATGRCLQEDHMTGEQAIEFARREAKKEALRIAGVKEHVWSVFGVNLSSEGNDPAFLEAYSEQSFVAIDGMLSGYEEKITTEFNADLGVPIRVVTITAYVDAEGQVEDLTYKLRVDGLKDTYNNGEEFDCTLRIYGYDSFIKVFYFNDEEADLIYPVEFDRGMLYSKDAVHKIPANTKFIATKSPEDEHAYVNMVFVATRRNFPYTAKPDAKSIMSWIYNLPADERAFEMRSITIR